ACTPSTYTSAPTRCARSAIARTSGRVPTALLAAVTATSRVRRLISSSYCHSGSSQVSMSTSAQRTTAPADHDLVADLPGLGQGAGDRVGQRGHVGAEDHSGRLAADQVGEGPPGRV